MKKNHNVNITVTKILAILFLSAVLLFSASCEKKAETQTKTAETESVVKHIKSKEEFKTIISTSKDRLLLFDFYAEWCPPCKELGPVLEKIAKENRDMVTVYKVNIDQHKDISSSFRITGIPHVVFIKNSEKLLALTGLYPKKMYLKAIKKFAASPGS